jgi:hypothetical protein
VELPRRGYDTRDVEALARESRESHSGGVGRLVVVVLIIAMLGAIVWYAMARG